MVGDCPGQFPIGELSQGSGFRPFRTKGDDSGRHRRRRQVHHVFLSWRFDRPDFLDLESHSGCRVSGPDGRYFPPTEVAPLIVVLHGPPPQRTIAAAAVPAEVVPSTDYDGCGRRLLEVLGGPPVAAMNGGVVAPLSRHSAFTIVTTWRRVPISGFFPLSSHSSEISSITGSTVSW